MDFREKVAIVTAAGGLGMDLDLSSSRDASGLQDPEVLLFSESNTRFLVEIPPQHRDQFEAAFADLPVVRLGTVSGHSRLTVTDSTHGTLIDSPLSELRHAWKAPLAWD